ncbi:MAG TPA: fumarylacetoacetate hydrolase family protein [Pirellulales bacterium]|nr:fumarylacetoacetate hydrolase family protein [Pirellulales bacterium]
MTHLAKFRLPAGDVSVGVVRENAIIPLAAPRGQPVTLTEILEDADPARRIAVLMDAEVRPIELDQVVLLPPIDRQEVWAAGVTYKRSKTARMEESKTAATLYDRVYEAARPELFFKATPHRVAGSGQALRIRHDSRWNVPEPELALVLNSRLKLIGYTVGNDMSSRDIEGENPLYLPQAKTYDACCGLGPWITLAEAMPPAAEIGIRLAVHRADRIVFEGKTDVAQMARPFDELIGWLGRDNSFPDGAILLTGTGVVPGNDFTLIAGDVVEITIDGIGTLRNPIVERQS